MNFLGYSFLIFNLGIITSNYLIKNTSNNLRIIILIGVTLLINRPINNLYNSRYY